MNGDEAVRYAESGVSLQAGREAVRRIAPLAASTRRPGSEGVIGAFGGLFDLGSLGMRHPLLVSSTDGVGTKLKLAFAMGIHRTVGIDAVAMCVNDVLTHGARPLFFLDYFATGRLDPAVAEAVVAGIAEGCREAGCALVGGETAEMPGMYADGEYDIAGYATGAVEKDCLIDGSAVRAGDVLLALPSSGLHSNGFSLVRRVVADGGLDLHSVCPELDTERPLGEVLLTPTRIYVRPVLGLLREVRVHGMAHITGGGWFENLPRMLPEGLGAEILTARIPVPRVFGWLQRVGGIPYSEMFHVFNMGVGMVMAVDPAEADRAADLLRAGGEAPFGIGSVVALPGGGERVVLK